MSESVVDTGRFQSRPSRGWVLSLLAIVVPASLTVAGVIIALTWTSSQTLTAMQGNLRMLSDRIEAMQRENSQALQAVSATTTQSSRDLERRVSDLELFRRTAGDQQTTITTQIAGLQAQSGALQSSVADVSHALDGIREMLLTGRRPPSVIGR